MEGILILPIRPPLIREPITKIEVERLALILEARNREKRANKAIGIILVTFLAVILVILLVSSISNV